MTGPGGAWPAGGRGAYLPPSPVDPPPTPASMDHLTAEQRAELEDELARQLARLEKSMKLSDQAAQTVELDQTAVGRLSRMDSLQNQSMAKNLAERERTKLALLLKAVERMQEGTYGICTECGAEVAYGRLVIFPETPTCAACG